MKVECWRKGSLEGREGEQGVPPTLASAALLSHVHSGLGLPHRRGCWSQKGVSESKVHLHLRGQLLGQTVTQIFKCLPLDRECGG